MDDFEEGYSDTLVDDRSPARDLGGEIVQVVADTGNTPEEQIDALVEAIKIIAEGQDGLLDRAAEGLMSA